MLISCFSIFISIIWPAICPIFPIYPICPIYPIYPIYPMFRILFPQFANLLFSQVFCHWLCSPIDLTSLNFRNVFKFDQRQLQTFNYTINLNLYLLQCPTVMKQLFSGSVNNDRIQTIVLNIVGLPFMIYLT